MQDYLQTTRRSVAFLKNNADSDRLDIKPPFQRNPVWLDPQKSFLIDTILRGYPIPELYMQDTVDAEGVERHIVVDGQQRVRACLEFIEGRFELDGATSPDWADFSFDDLSAVEKKRFYEYAFIVRLLPDVPDDEIRVIFQRLNRNVVALNKQELRHATYWGEFISCVESIAEREFWVTSGLFTANDIRRMLDVEFISELAIAALHGPQNKKDSLDKWYATYEETFDDREMLETLFTTVLGELGKVLPDISRTRWSKKSDFYTLFSVFADHVGDLPLAREARAEMSESLTSFGQKVDSYLKKASRSGRPPKYAAPYALAVERAASDLANRRAREASLEAYLSEIWDS